MEQAKGKKWESLFGEAPENNFNQPNNFEILNHIVQGAVNQKDAMRKAVGENFLEKIEEHQTLLKSGTVKGKMKANLENELRSMTRLARMDVTNLGYLLERALMAFYSIYDEDEIKRISVIIDQIMALTTEQVECLRRVHCSINIKVIEKIKENLIAQTYERLLLSIKVGDYQDSLVPLISIYYVYSEHQAKNLLLKAQQATKHHPENADDFLEVLNLRLFSPQSTQPHQIDYRVLKQNKLINDPNFMGYKTGDLMMLCAFKNFAINIGGYLWEARLKEHYVDVVRAIDALICISAQKHPKNYYSMFTRYYQDHPDG